MESIRDGSAGRMSPAPSPPIKEKTSKQSLTQSAKSKMKPAMFLNVKSGNPRERFWETIFPSRGEFSMRSFGEFPNEENASSLSRILQAGVPDKYYLSPKACKGILRRASVRGKELPAVLKTALTRQASVMTDITAV
jgi:hypothetical protein